MATPVTSLATDADHGLALIPADQVARHKSTANGRAQRRRKEPVGYLLNLIDSDIAGTGSRFYEQRIRLALKILENRNFTRGQQMQVFDWNRWQYTNMQQNRNLSYAAQMLLTVNNRILPAYMANLKEVMASNPVFSANPRNDLPEKAAACRVAQSYIDYYRDRNSKPSLQHEAAGYQMQCGNVFIETFYDRDAGGYVELPKWDDNVIPGDEMYGCQMCGATGAMSDLAQDGQMPPVGDVGGKQMVGALCPNPECQQPALEYGQTPSITTQVPAGTQTKKVGVTNSKYLDPLGIIFDYTKKTIQESTFFYEEEAVTRHELEAAYPWAEIPSVPLSEVLRVKLSLERSVGANSIPTSTWVGNDAMSGSPFELIRRERTWFEAPLYAEIELESALTIGDPDNGAFTIPAGVKLGEVFPDGLRIYKVAKTILNVANEAKNKRLSHYCWIKNIDSAWGDDLISPVVQLQKRYNELDSLEMQNNMANATATVFIDRNAVDMTGWNSSPVSNVITLNQAAPGAGIKGQLFEVLPALPIAEQVVNQKDHLAADILYLMNAQPIPHDTQDQQIKTATEAAIARDMQVGLIGPPMALRAEGNINAIYQCLAYEQEFYVPGQYPFLGQYHDYEMKAFLACDIERDIEITYVAGSHIPRTTQDVKLNALALLQMGNVPGGIFNKQMFPISDDMLSSIVELFGNPLDMDALMPDRRNAEKRLQLIQQIVLREVPKMQVVDINAPVPQQALPDPQTGQPVPNPAFQQYQQIIQQVIGEVPFQPEIDDMTQLAAVYVKWMKTDDGTNAPTFLKQCVLAMINQAHQTATDAANQAKEGQLSDAAHVGILNAAPKLLEIGLKGDQELEKAKVIHGHESEQAAMQREHEMDQQAMAQSHEAQQNTQQQSADAEMQENEPEPAGGE